MSGLRGLSKVLRNLNKSIEQIRGNSIKGLTEAALVVKADSVKETPILVGNLRGSAYILVTDGLSDNVSASFKGDDAVQLSESHNRALAESKQIVQKDGKWVPTAIVGYGAYYAFYVHEMPSSYNFNSGSSQFLTKALMKNRARIKQILVKWNKI